MGRGAMGITYKAFDVDLHCPRHPKSSVKSISVKNRRAFAFCASPRGSERPSPQMLRRSSTLGRTGQATSRDGVCGRSDTGELIRRSGPLEVKLALEVTTQVATGLTAVPQKQNLVHRDIKPSIYGGLAGEALLTAKIIDLGLAKTVDESASEAGISIAGGICRDTRVCKSRQFADLPVDALPLGFVFAGCYALGDGDAQSAISRHSR